MHFEYFVVLLLQIYKKYACPCNFRDHRQQKRKNGVVKIPMEKLIRELAFDMNVKKIEDRETAKKLSLDNGI
jgi:hypothetical protein